MTFNCAKLGHAVTFMEYLDNVVSLIILPNTSIWNKITFWLSNSLNLAELVVCELRRVSPKNLPIFHSLSDLSLLIVTTSGPYN